MDNLLRYTNGRGHLIMSILMSLIGLCMVLLTNDASIKAVGITLILTVQGAWFIPGAAKQVAHEVSMQMSIPLPAITPVAPAQPEDPEDTQPRPIVKV